MQGVVLHVSGASAEGAFQWLAQMALELMRPMQKYFAAPTSPLPFFLAVRGNGSSGADIPSNAPEAIGMHLLKTHQNSLFRTGLRVCGAQRRKSFIIDVISSSVTQLKSVFGGPQGTRLSGTPLAAFT